MLRESHSFLSLNGINFLLQLLISIDIILLKYFKKIFNTFENIPKVKLNNLHLNYLIQILLKRN